ncbi:hypothetical protein KP509_28G045300 [Ceratopteris richardii]|uniref:thymidine kinase n=1 Tax=Ceratopteris richardii TaxID=49495 RepID=A0A8T2RBN3_CERRI|nr:hypothetical protein KP509_28G045300 [Ceratopteris richardii]
MVEERSETALDVLTASIDFSVAYSTAPDPRGKMQLKCSSSKASVLEYGGSASNDQERLVGNQNAVVPSGCGIQVLCSVSDPARYEGGSMLEDSLNLLQDSSIQKYDLKLEATSKHPRDGLQIGQHNTICGSIHLIVGPMFAGKTTALLQRVQAEASTGRKVVLVKSNKDTRYGISSVVSHDGKHMPCWAVPSLESFRSQIGEEQYANIDLIGIDEAQFFKDLCSFCQAAADYEGKTLIVAGLDGDFERNKFGPILDLIPFADSIVKLTSHCELCGKPASFTFRKTDDKNKEMIGGADIYMPVCRQHYYSGQVALEATQKSLEQTMFLSLD